MSNLEYLFLRCWKIGPFHNIGADGDMAWDKIKLEVFSLENGLLKDKVIQISEGLSHLYSVIQEDRTGTK